MVLSVDVAVVHSLKSSVNCCKSLCEQLKWPPCLKGTTTADLCRFPFDVKGHCWNAFNANGWSVKATCSWYDLTLKNNCGPF